VNKIVEINHNIIGLTARKTIPPSLCFLYLQPIFQIIISHLV
jgi:hypothetical protein